jgi:hypothetical protein
MSVTERDADSWSRAYLARKIPLRYGTLVHFYNARQIGAHA